MTMMNQGRGEILWDRAMEERLVVYAEGEAFWRFLGGVVVVVGGWSGLI